MKFAVLFFLSLILVSAGMVAGVFFLMLVMTYPIALLAIPGVIFVWWALGPPARRR